MKEGVAGLLEEGEVATRKEGGDREEPEEQGWTVGQ